MASIYELENKVKNLTSQLEDANTNLKRQQSVLAYNLEEAAKYTAQAANLPDGSPEKAAALSVAAKQTANADYLKTTQLANAQAEVDALTQQLADANQQLIDAKTAPPAPPDSAAAPTTTTPDPAKENTGSTPLSNNELSALGNSQAPPGEASYTPPATNTTTYYENDGSASKTTAPVAVGTDTPASVTPKAATTNNITPNPLNNFASYTYNITLFILSKDDFNSLSTGTASSWNPSQALISSAGRYNNTSTTGTSTTVRNPQFLDNFFFDNLDIQTVIGLNDGSRGSNAIELKFSIIEPYGLTLLDRLIASSAALGGANYTQQPYLLQIDFFGITDDGTLTELSSQRKRIPINITDFNIKVSKAGAHYDVTCIPYNHMAFTTYNNSSPGSFEITASTVKEFFDPNADNSGDSALADKNRLETNLINAQNALVSANASTLRSKPLLVDTAAKNVAAAQQALDNANYKVRSFADAWNAWHLHVKDAKIATDNNEIAFVIDPIIANSKIVDADGSTTSPGQTPMTNSAGKVAEVKVQTGASKSNNNYQTSKKAFHVAQGDSIIKIIEDVIRQSDYVRNQLVNDTQTNKLALPTNKDFNWFKIIPQIELKSFDTNRNEYATKTTYHVVPYTVKNTKHPQVALSGPPSPVKEYNYIYTGLNTDVLDFDIEFKAAYYVAVTLDKNALQSTSGSPVSDADSGVGSTTGIIPPAPNSATPRVTKVYGNDAQAGATMDAGRDAKSQLAGNFIKSIYTGSAGDMINLKLKINGDPTLIKQDDVYSNPGQTDYSSHPGLDQNTGSITMDSGQVFCKINFLTPSDIDTDTGLLAKNGQYINSSFNGYYNILTVENHFSHGKFEQVLELYRLFDFTNASTNTERSATATGVASATPTDSSSTTPPPAISSTATTYYENDGTSSSTSTALSAQGAKFGTDAVDTVANSKEIADLKAVGANAETISADKDKADADVSKEPAANVPNAEDEAKKAAEKAANEQTVADLQAQKTAIVTSPEYIAESQATDALNAADAALQKATVYANRAKTKLSFQPDDPALKQAVIDTEAAAQAAQAANDEAYTASETASANAKGLIEKVNNLNSQIYQLNKKLGKSS